MRAAGQDPPAGRAEDQLPRAKLLGELERGEVGADHDGSTAALLDYYLRHRA